MAVDETGSVFQKPNTEEFTEYWWNLQKFIAESQYHQIYVLRVPSRRGLETGFEIDETRVSSIK